MSSGYVVTPRALVEITKRRDWIVRHHGGPEAMRFMAFIVGEFRSLDHSAIGSAPRSGEQGSAGTVLIKPAGRYLIVYEIGESVFIHAVLHAHLDPAQLKRIIAARVRLNRREGYGQ